MPFSLLKYGLRARHASFRDLPLTPELKRSYDVVVIGGGGHGLAAAYYLSNVHGIRNIAVLEKGYLAGGNTARNTTTIRSNYINRESIPLLQGRRRTLRDDVAGSRLQRHVLASAGS